MKCHDKDIKLKGPDLSNVTKRRKFEWILNMMLRPEEMILRDSIAKKLFFEHGTKMVVKDLKKDEADAVLEYLKKVDIKADTIKK